MGDLIPFAPHLQVQGASGPSAPRLRHLCHWRY